MQKIRKILIANRGEIALRVIRSAREMGIGTVAVFSEADRNAPHVRFADEAVCIGPPPSSKSYLQIEGIIHAATTTGADAIHPGYGFLSENSDFADAVTKAGIIFIGPPASAIKLMGNKLAAKEAVTKKNVPLIPGTMKAISDVAEAKKIAAKIGYPVLIKASSGGGGKGMRVVEKEEDLKSQMERAISEASSHFADGSIFIERYIVAPRHIEFQILGDQHGNIVHFFERECSVQRRHQKVVEEAPSSILTPEMREKMGKTAISVGHSCGYYGAGTVEFMMDKDKNFYFLEMNTRLQVEHPVTEAITGVDLVKLQIKVAQGMPLPLKQEDLRISGHAIESRVYAEDPASGFLPDTGMLESYNRPQGNGIRVDDGFEQGMDIPFHYDPMIGKLICHASSRAGAIEKMIKAIDEYEIVGVKTTLGFCSFVMQHEAFRSGQFDTGFVEKHFSSEMLEKKGNEKERKLAAMMALKLLNQSTPQSPSTFSGRGTTSRWKQNRL